MNKPYVSSREKGNIILKQIQVALQAIVRLIAVNVSISNPHFTITISLHGIEYFKHCKTENLPISWKEVPQNTRIELLSELAKELVILVRTQKQKEREETIH